MKVPLFLFMTVNMYILYIICRAVLLCNKTRQVLYNTASLKNTFVVYEILDLSQNICNTFKNHWRYKQSLKEIISIS